MKKDRSADPASWKSVFTIMEEVTLLVRTFQLSKKLLFLGGVSLLAVILWPAAAMAAPPSPLNPAAQKAQISSDFYWFTFVIAAAIFVLVEGLLIYAVIRFRQRKPDEIPRQVHGNTTLELIWTIIPALILVVVFVFMFRNLVVIAEVPSDAMKVTVTGHQWWWEFEYPDLGIVTANELHVPEGQPVVIELHSDNVIHSFWIPRLSGKTDVIPGQVNTTWFIAEEAGTYRGQCAELCGAQHANMNFLIVAQPEAEFEQWVEQQQSPPEPVTGLAAEGEQAFLTGQCIACHVVEGTIAQGQIGPDLTHVASRSVIAGMVLENTPENLESWLTDPQAVKPHNLMVIDPLSQAEIDALVAYLTSLQ